jgi:hypothetical protein
MSSRGAFRFVALPAERFAPLFALDDEALSAIGARRIRAYEKPGFPCRVSLEDAEPGESVLLLPFEHHDADSPYRSSGPIFVREHARTASPEPGEIPEFLRFRLLSVRAYDGAGMLTASEVAEGRELESVIERLFEDATVVTLHVHNARPGCFNCRVVRA